MISVVYSLRASSTLDKVRDKAEAIEEDVRNRLDDLIKRAAPSEQERALSASIPEFLKAVLANPETTKLLLEMALKERGQAAD